MSKLKQKVVKNVKILTDNSLKGMACYDPNKKQVLLNMEVHIDYTATQGGGVHDFILVLADSLAHELYHMCEDSLRAKIPHDQIYEQLRRVNPDIISIMHARDLRNHVKDLQGRLREADESYRLLSKQHGKTVKDLRLAQEEIVKYKDTIYEFCKTHNIELPVSPKLYS